MIDWQLLLSFFSLVAFIVFITIAILLIKQNRIIKTKAIKQQLKNKRLILWIIFIISLLIFLVTFILIIFLTP